MKSYLFCTSQHPKYYRFHGEAVVYLTSFALNLPRNSLKSIGRESHEITGLDTPQATEITPLSVFF